MLCNKFILDMSKPILTLINHFEEEEPNIFDWFNILGEFLSKFLINGGQKDSDLVKTKDILSIDVSDCSLQLDDKDLYLGPKAKAFINKLGLNLKYPELVIWMNQVRAFYSESLIKVHKYFKPALSSKLLMDCDMFNPKTLLTTNLDDLKNKLKNIASRFSNVIKREEQRDEGVGWNGFTVHVLLQVDELEGGQVQAPGQACLCHLDCS